MVLLLLSSSGGYLFNATSVTSYLLLPVASHWLVPKPGHTAQAVETYSNREPTGCFCSPATRSIRPDTNAPPEAWRNAGHFALWSSIPLASFSSGSSRRTSPPGRWCMVCCMASSRFLLRRPTVDRTARLSPVAASPEANSGQNGASVSSRSLSGGMRAKASFCSWLNLPTIPLTLKWPLGNAFNQNTTSFGSLTK